MKSLKLLACCLGFALGLVLAVAATSQEARADRTAKPFGVYLGLLGNPFPSIWGVNVGYNALPFLRGSIGYGKTSVSDPTITVDASTIAFEAKGTVPDWNFSPCVSLGYTNVSMTISGTGSTDSLAGLSGSGGSMYVGFGFDWQTNVGFALGLEYKLLLTSGGSGLPAIYLGWYF